MGLDHNSKNLQESPYKSVCVYKCVYVTSVDICDKSWDHKEGPRGRCIKLLER